jgi:2,3-bisphosphoglycerate-independent phosphoglycerate mutase
MKYVIIIPDGCADEKQESLGGKTPLEAAKTACVDSIVAEGTTGLAWHVPDDLVPGSDVANLSLLGYDPRQTYTGRAPLEAAASGIELGPDDWALRCNLVTIENQSMKSFTAGHISTDEAKSLLASLNEQVDSSRFEYYPGVGYRNLLICRDAGGKVPLGTSTRTTPPHDLTDQSILDDYPRGPGSDLLVKLMDQSAAIFADHPVNQKRIAQGKLLATSTWLWGEGKKPVLDSFAKGYGPSGAMITAVDLLRGLARSIGWQVVEVEGATGYTDTNYAAKGAAVIDALQKVDLVCVHVEAPDEASHEGDLEAKIKAIESIDKDIIGPVHEALKRMGDYRILVSPDHPTPIATKTHSRGPVPWAVAGAGIEPDANQKFDESTAEKGEKRFPAGWEMMKWFIG